MPKAAETISGDQSFEQLKDQILIARRDFLDCVW